MDYVRYIDKTRAYYLSQGYAEPYRWAHFDDVPFTRLKKPLAECTVALVSTSDVAVRRDGEADQKVDPGSLLQGNVYSIPADTPIEKLYTHQEHYDRHATHLDDVNTYFPITRLREFLAQGKIGGVAARAHGVYTAYSTKKTLEIDAPQVLKLCLEDGVDAVLLTPV